MMQAEIMVSVIVTSYNYDAFISKTLDSIVSQTFKNYEVIVVDDGSTDNSLEIIESYVHHFDNIKLYCHPNHSNQGLKASLILGIKKAKGRFLAFLESDDLWSPDYLETKLRYIKKYNSKFIFNDVFFLCENSSQNRKIQLEEYIKRQYRSWGVQENDNKVLNLQNSMIYENCVPTFSCVMLDRELFSAIDFDTPVERWLDWWLWIQISQMVPFLFINRKLTIWRLHSDSFNSVLSLSKQMSDREKWHLNLKRVIKSGTLSNKLIVHSPFLLVLIYSGIKMLKRKGLLFTVKKAGSVISTLLKH